MTTVQLIKGPSRITSARSLDLAHMAGIFLRISATRISRSIYVAKDP
jgi:hypothetical protein